MIKFHKPHAQKLAFFWLAFACIPIIAMLYNIAQGKFSGNLGFDVGIAAILGPMYGLYENAFQPNLPFPTDTSMNVAISAFLVIAILISCFKQHFTWRFLSVIAIAIWCLYGCSLVLRHFV